MRIRGGPCAIQDIKASCPLFLRHAASAGGFAESTWNSLLYHGLEPCGPGSVAAAPGADDGPTSQLCLFFRSSNRETLPYFLTGTLASLLFGRLGSKLSLLFGFLYAAFVVPVDGPTPEGQVIRWLMTYIRVATVSLGIGVSQALLNVAAKLRAGYSRPRQ